MTQTVDLGFDALARIEEIRISLKWSHAELARKANIGINTLQQARRRGYQPSHSTILAVCAAAGMDLDQFYMSSSDKAVILSPARQSIHFKMNLLDEEEQKTVETVINSILRAKRTAFFHTKREG